MPFWRGPKWAPDLWESGDCMISTLDILKAGKAAWPALRRADDALRQKAMHAMADALVANSDAILQANRLDMQQAAGTLSAVMLDRLALSESRIQGMADGIRQAAALPCPTGRVLDRIVRPNGLIIEKVSSPLGLLAVIYESRPNVTADAAALAVKSGNACVLRSGKEAWRSANAIVQAMQNGLRSVGLPGELVQLVQDTSRESAAVLMTAVGLVDLLIPRGGAGLIRNCVENAKVPCIQTGTGICHVYVEKTADQDMALTVLENAKTSRPSVCNAAEVCLVDEAIAAEFLPKLAKQLGADRAKAGLQPVELRGDAAAAAILGTKAWGEEAFTTEFLDYILGVKVVRDVEEAVAHIEGHSTGHSDAILTRDEAAADYFTVNVDSAAVYVNASTRFTDGGEFGQGCEIGISTQKLHARGPLGPAELTTYRYVIRGEGQTR